MKELTEDQLLANEIEQVYRQFMHMPNRHSYTVSTLWVLHTHLRDSTGKFLPYITPRLYYGSKLPGCGKTLATELTVKMSHNGEIVLEPTPPSITTMMNQDLSTLGFDEIDTYFGRGRGKDSMRAILNGGYKFGAKVTRQRGDETERLNSHGPICLNGKNANLFLTHENFGTLRSRSICIILDEKPIGAQVSRFSPERHDVRLNATMKRAKRWGLLNARAITSIPEDGLMPEKIANRAEELWTILFRIAHHLGDNWPAKCEAAARAFVLGEWEDDTPCVSPAEELLICVRKCFRDGETFLPTGEILNRLEKLETEDQPSLMREWDGVSEKAASMGLASAMAIFEIEKVRMRQGGTADRGYTLASLCTNRTNLNEPYQPDAGVPTEERNERENAMGTSRRGGDNQDRVPTDTRRAARQPGRVRVPENSHLRLADPSNAAVDANRATVRSPRRAYTVVSTVSPRKRNQWLTSGTRAAQPRSRTLKTKSAGSNSPNA